jgi:hypothetical protein
VRADLHDDYVLVTLSKRNLLALLQRVDDPFALRLLTGGYVYRDRELTDGITLIVGCQPDAEHYADREPPGRMKPSTEAFIARLDGSEGNAN